MRAALAKIHIAKKELGLDDDTYRDLNRPGFTGECFVQNLSDFIKFIHICIEELLCFLWCDISDCAVQAFGVEPVHPFQCFPFNLAQGFLGAHEVDNFCFEQTDCAFGQRVVV